VLLVRSSAEHLHNSSPGDGVSTLTVRSQPSSPKPHAKTSSSFLRPGIHKSHSLSRRPNSQNLAQNWLPCHRLVGESRYSRPDDYVPTWSRFWRRGLPLVLRESDLSDYFWTVNERGILVHREKNRKISYYSFANFL